MKKCIILCCVLWSTISFASESDYTKLWCAQQKGMVEVKLADSTRCDCLTTTHAIEVDYANKFYEAVGQSLHYSIMTNRLPGILLLIKNNKDNIYLTRLRKIILMYKLPITIWTLKINN